VDENAGSAGPPQLPAGASWPPPPPPPPPQGWSPLQAPPPPAPWGQGWNPVAAPQSKRPLWDSISLGLGGGSLYLGFGALACAGLGLLLYKAPITSTHTGVNGAVDRAVGRFVLDLFALMFAFGGVAGGAVGGIAGLAGLITRRVTFAALSVLGVAVSVAGFAVGWYVLAGITSWHF
jgi:hypothetical protein